MAHSLRLKNRTCPENLPAVPTNMLQLGEKTCSEKTVSSVTPETKRQSEDERSCDNDFQLTNVTNILRPVIHPPLAECIQFSRFSMSEYIKKKKHFKNKYHKHLDSLNTQFHKRLSDLNTTCEITKNCCVDNIKNKAHEIEMLEAELLNLQRKVQSFV